MGLAHIIVGEGWHDESWLLENTVGWPQFRKRLVDYPPERVACITGLAQEDLLGLAKLYARTKPALIKIADGMNRNLNGGQNVRAVCALPALTAQYGLHGGGLAYSASGYAQWDAAAVGHAAECPLPGRTVNMNRLGAALLGDVEGAPIKSLFVFGANPAASTPNAGKIVEGLQREDLFTVVHELFLTDTAVYADIVLPATSQLEQVDLHKAYGHTHITYNRAAIPPLEEARSNWDVMRALAATMGFEEPWLQQSADEVIDEVLTATAANNPAMCDITLERLQTEHTVGLSLPAEPPFAGGQFRTPSGKVELYCQGLADMGLDPLPGWQERFDDGGVANVQDSSSVEARFAPEMSMQLVTGAAHYFVSSSLANQPGLLQREGEPLLEIHPADAAARQIESGDSVIVENGRGWFQVRAIVTDGVRPGVAVTPKGRWPRRSDGRNANWTTPDALGDMAGQSTFQSNRIWVRRAG